MKNDIKEILDILQKCEDYDDEVYLIKQYGATLLLDYITNLQEENEMYAQLKDEYEDIIDKATEYVNNTIFWGMYENIPMIDTKYGEDLSNILQGENNDKD
jgi:hypothetical protein